MDEIIKDLNELLSDLCVFYRKLQNYHWNVKGKEFFTVHAKLEEYYDEVNEQIDELAEHILTLGYQPLGTLQDYLNNTELAEAKNEKISENLVFTNVKEDIKIILEKVKQIKQTSDDKEVYITSALMDDYMKAYSKTLWMINQMQEQ